MLAALATEHVDPRYAQIDLMEVPQLAALMNAADQIVPLAVRDALPSISAAIEAVTARLSSGGRLIYVGAGTPGRIGVMDAAECSPTFGTPPPEVIAIIAGGDSALHAAQEGSEDDLAGGIRDIADARVQKRDAVVGISASGRTPFVLGALREANARGALTVAVVNSEGSVLATEATHGIEVVVGPELISGSTRLKAATAQKLVVNMISTIVMVQLGKTYGNLMVDVRPTNHKLRERAVRILATITGLDDDAARSALEESGYDIKGSALAVSLGLSPELAEERLLASNGRLRQALEGPR